MDLFAGCGGLSLGAAEGARRVGRSTSIVLAVDNNETATDVFSLNFPSATVVTHDLAELFDGRLGAKLTATEREMAKEIRLVDLLLAGAPCQGHSNLNNHTRGRDPRNELYLRAVRAVEVLRPWHVLLENVPTIQRDSKGVLDTALQVLKEVGYSTASKITNLGDFGVPQTRHRHLLLASRLRAIDPAVVLENATIACLSHPLRPVRWAIDDLKNVDPIEDIDTPSIPSRENSERIRWLFKNGAYDLPNRRRPSCHHGDHTYASMYGRLRWDKPAQTITTGFGSMGQGRYVHPRRRRTLTPHEAARLQTFPDFFSFDGVRSRDALSRLIGNAVPPLVTLRLIGHLLAGKDRMNGSTPALAGSRRPRVSRRR